MTWAGEKGEIAGQARNDEKSPPAMTCNVRMTVLDAPLPYKGGFPTGHGCFRASPMEILKEAGRLPTHLCHLERNECNERSRKIQSLRCWSECLHSLKHHLSAFSLQKGLQPVCRGSDPSAARYALLLVLQTRQDYRPDG